MSSVLLEGSTPTNKSRACPKEGSLPGDSGGGKSGLHPGKACRLWMGPLGFSLFLGLITCLTPGVLLNPAVDFLFLSVKGGK